MPIKQAFVDSPSNEKVLILEAMATLRKTSFFNRIRVNVSRNVLSLLRSAKGDSEGKDQLIEDAVAFRTVERTLNDLESIGNDD